MVGYEREVWLLKDENQPIHRFNDPEAQALSGLLAQLRQTKRQTATIAMARPPMVIDEVVALNLQQGIENSLDSNSQESVPTTVWDSPGLRESTKCLQCRYQLRLRSPSQLLRRCWRLRRYWL